jgi:SAM-dependent methyltransferase
MLKSPPKNRPKSHAHWSARAKTFWEQRQRRAPEGALTGYLLDESPPGIGEHRFEGEWRELKSWLDRAGLARERCLDLGCGTGIWLKALAGEFGHVEGWDYAPAMLKASRLTLNKAGIKSATLRCGQITQRRGSKVFDLIFVGGVLMYTPEEALGPLLKSLARLCKPGGMLVLRESTFEGETWLREGEPLRGGLLASPGQKPDLDYVAVYRSAVKLEQGLSEAGFSVQLRRPNRHYKLSDLTEDWLRRLNWLCAGKLGSSGAMAESAAAWIYRLRLFTLYPEYFLRRWKLRNEWLICRLNQKKSQAPKT